MRPFFFFFSSRRRHTRSDRDWSSDVCSSDLCIKQILDPELPARDFRVDSVRREAERGSANLVPNIFCENALETALQFREAHGGKITAITCGPAGAEDVLRKALALKADEAALVLNEAASNPDPLFVAR